MNAYPSHAELVAEEDRLTFGSFDDDDAWALGCRLVAVARELRAPVAVDITRNGQRMFHAALPGASAELADWIERKARVTQRCGHSSLAVAQLWHERGTTYEAVLGLHAHGLTASGGSFPVAVRGVGLVGTVTASGLPDLEDHRLVVRAVTDHLTAD